MNRQLVACLAAACVATVGATAQALPCNYVRQKIQECDQLIANARDSINQLGLRGAKLAEMQQQIAKVTQIRAHYQGELATCGDGSSGGAGAGMTPAPGGQQNNVSAAIQGVGNLMQNILSDMQRRDAEREAERQREAAERAQREQQEALQRQMEEAQHAAAIAEMKRGLENTFNEAPEVPPPATPSWLVCNFRKPPPGAPPCSDAQKAEYDQHLGEIYGNTTVPDAPQPVQPGGATEVTFSDPAPAPAATATPPVDAAQDEAARRAAQIAEEKEVEAAEHDTASPSDYARASDLSAHTPLPDAIFDGAATPPPQVLDDMRTDAAGAVEHRGLDAAPSSVLGAPVPEGDSPLGAVGDKVVEAQPTAEAKIAQTEINGVMEQLPEKVSDCLGAGGHCDPDLHMGGVAYRLLPEFVRKDVDRAQAVVQDYHTVEHALDQAGARLHDTAARFGCWINGCAPPDAEGK